MARPPLPARGADVGIWDQAVRDAINDTSDRADGDSPTSTVSGSSTTLIASQSGAMLEMTSASANTVIVPPNVFSQGQVTEVCQAGTGPTSIVAGSGLSLRCRGKTAPIQLAGQWAEVRIRFRSATEAVVSGDVA